MTKQYAIHIMQDTCPENPWNCDTGLPPILVASNAMGGYDVHGYGLEDEVPHMDRDVVLKHWREMLEMMELEPTWDNLKALAREDRYYTQATLDRLVAQVMEDFIMDANASDRLDMLADVYRWLGCPAYVGSTQGYSQGDYAEVLVVWTKEWMKQVGVSTVDPEAVQKDLELAVKIYGAWAWGDVYGWMVTEATEDYEEARGCYELQVSADNNTVAYWNYDEGPRGEDIESCWGYYGDWEHSYMVSEADAVIRDLKAKDAKEAEERAEWVRVLSPGPQPHHNTQVRDLESFLERQRQRMKRTNW